MKIVILIFCLQSSLFSLAHEHHGGHGEHETMSGEHVPPGTSLFHLETKWTGMNGESMTLSTLAGKPRLMAMLYTRCLTACPLLVDDIQSVLSTLPEKGKNFEVSLFSFDSESETPETMKAFIKKRSLGPNWRVYKSDKDGVADLAAALGVRYKKLKNGDYIHSNSIFLVDEKGVVLKQKDGLNSKDKAFNEAVKKTANK